MTIRVVQLGTDKIPIYSKHSGAIEHYIKNISQNLLNFDVELHIITIGENEEHVYKNNVFIHIISLNTYFNIISSNIVKLLNEHDKNVPYITLKIIKTLLHIEKNHGPIDVIHTHYTTVSYAPIIYANLLGKKTITIRHYHSIFPTKNNLFFEKLIATKYKLLFTVSNFIGENVANAFNLNKNKVITVYNGVDKKEFIYDEKKRKNIREKYNIGKNDKVILYVGRIIPNKGLHSIIKILPKLKDKINKVKLIIVGPKGDYNDSSSNYFDEIIKLNNELNVNDNVIYAGFIERGKVASYYSASDVFVFPSYYQEACPTVILEAISCSIPVVAYNNGAVNELIQDNIDGFLVEQDDLENLYNKIIDSFEISRNNNGRKRIIETFSYEAISKQLFSIYKNYEQIGERK